MKIYNNYNKKRCERLIILMENELVELANFEKHLLHTGKFNTPTIICELESHVIEKFVHMYEEMEKNNSFDQINTDKLHIQAKDVQNIIDFVKELNQYTPANKNNNPTKIFQTF